MVILTTMYRHTNLHTAVIKCGYIILLFFLLPATLYSQVKEPYNIYSYNVNEGLLQSTISDICVDKDNYLWIGFPNGLQRYDGVHFNTVPVQPGLPDYKHLRFFRTSKGELWLAHQNGISRYLSPSNRFAPLYSTAEKGTRSFIFIGENKGVLYFFTPTGNITGIDINTYKVVADKNAGFFLPGSGDTVIVKFSSNISGDAVAVNINKRIYRWHLLQQQSIDSSAIIPGMLSYFLYLQSNTEVLYYNNGQITGLMLYDFSKKTPRPLLAKETAGRKTGRCCIYKWQNKTLLSLNNHLYETDNLLSSLNKELVNFQFEPAGNNLSVTHITEDNFGNLWLQTVTGGLKKISRKQYPLRYYGTPEKEKNNVISLLPDKAANKILGGTTGNGLLVFDTLGQLIKHIKILPGQENPFTIAAIARDNNGDYLLFVNGEKNIWQLSHDLSVLKARPAEPQHALSRGIHYFGNSLFTNRHRTAVQTEGKIYTVPANGQAAKEFYFSRAYIMSGMQYGSHILTHGNDELLFVDTIHFSIVKRIPFPNTGNVRCFAKGGGDTVYIGSNKGIFCINGNGQTLFHLDKKAGLPDECIYAMAPLSDGHIWCSSNKGLFRINSNREVLQIKKEHGIQENEFNTNAVGIDTDGELFFGGVNGISSLYPGTINTGAEKVQVLFTSIQFNNRELFTDTAVSSVDRLDLSYDKNSLSFQFTVMGASAATDYVCQYKMKGIDDEWLTAQAMQTIHYFLPPGNYTLQVYAGAAYNPGAKPIKELHIHIAPPFWKTWWFTGIALLALLAVVVFAINRYNAKKYRGRLMAMEAEHKVQLERERISRDLHDSIGAYANAVLYNTELLQQQKGFDEKNELMNDLKFASKDIINALRDTVWALKKEAYTAEDCLIRIRNFIQPFNRYYGHISFTVEGEAPAELRLNHAHALNVIRIVQEAVTNAIKHADASHVKIKSDTKPGVWKLSIEDNGKGFTEENTGAGKEGNGLVNMKQRAADSGFELTIDSQKGKGTIVSILI